MFGGGGACAAQRATSSSSSSSTSSRSSSKSSTAKLAPSICCGCSLGSWLLAALAGAAPRSASPTASPTQDAPLLLAAAPCGAMASCSISCASRLSSLLAVALPSASLGDDPVPTTRELCWFRSRWLLHAGWQRGSLSLKHRVVFSPLHWRCLDPGS